jgi:pectate lyase
VQVTTLAQLVSFLESTTPYEVEIMNDIDMSPLANHSGGFPSSYPTGEILVRSHKTIYSRNGFTLRRSSLRIGKASLGPRKNIIIRNLRFRDLWVNDPSGNYDTYGWDYIHIEEGSHHIWVDHCDFEKVYDGMVDMTHAVDFVTVSWCVLRSQKKCHLIGHSDGNSAEDTGHFNVTFHHNHYLDVEERIPRMRYGNAHVYNLLCENLGGNGIQSTASAATLVENCHFLHPQSGTNPTRFENGGLLGIIKVSGSLITNLPGVSVTFQQRNADTFSFNPPFATPAPPYTYTLDPVAELAVKVPKYAGVGKLGFVFWQQDYFAPAELDAPAISGLQAVLTADGATNGSLQTWEATRHS